MQLLLLLALLLSSGGEHTATAAAAAEASSTAPLVQSNASEITPFITEGSSMSPTIESGDRLDVDETYYRKQPVRRGDIIVFHAPDKRTFVKRIVGLPGESLRIRRSDLFINHKLNLDMMLKGNVTENAEVKLSNTEIYVLGDNYANSYDSRYIGPVRTDSIIGKVVNIEHQRYDLKQKHSP